MPVRRLRGVGTPLERAVRSPADCLRAALEVTQLCRWLAGASPRRGVQRFGSLAEAQATERSTRRGQAQPGG